MKIIEQQQSLEKSVENFINPDSANRHILNSQNDPNRRYHWGLTRNETVSRLKEMQTSGVTQEKLEALFKIPYWGSDSCDECYSHPERLVHFGAEPDYDARWQILCVDCLQKGISGAGVPPSGPSLGLSRRDISLG